MMIYQLHKYIQMYYSYSYICFLEMFVFFIISFIIITIYVLKHSIKM